MDGNWTPFQGWGRCSVDCGQGKRTRARYCENPPPRHGGKPCDGADGKIEIQTGDCDGRHGPCPSKEIRKP